MNYDGKIPTKVEKPLPRFRWETTAHGAFLRCNLSPVPCSRGTMAENAIKHSAGCHLYLVFRWATSERCIMAVWVGNVLQGIGACYMFPALRPLPNSTFQIKVPNTATKKFDK